MLNDLLDAISRRLGQLFPDCRIYTEGEETDWEKPCFHVSVKELSGRPAPGRRFYRDSGFTVRYFPGETGQKNREINQVMDGLMDGTEFVTLADGSPVRLSKQSGQVEHGVLNFSLNCSLCLNELEEPAEMMETVEIKKVVRS